MALFDVTSLLDPGLFLGRMRVRSTVGIDVGADVGEEVGSIARFADGGFEALQLATVVLEDFAMTGEVVLFQGRSCQGGFGVEEAGELGDKGVTLDGVSFITHTLSLSFLSVVV